MHAEDLIANQDVFKISLGKSLKKQPKEKAKAIHEEFKSLMERGTWKPILNSRPGCNIIPGNKLISEKYDPTGRF